METVPTEIENGIIDAVADSSVAVFEGIDA